MMKATTKKVPIALRVRCLRMDGLGRPAGSGKGTLLRRFIT